MGSQDIEKYSELIKMAMPFSQSEPREFRLSD